MPELVEALKARDHELAERGYHSQVHLDDASSLLFLLDEKRIALRWNEGQFSARDKTWSPADLQGQAERLSPNALLRPVMQDYLLPTITYVGGPAEIAYMAQSQVSVRKTPRTYACHFSAQQFHNSRQPSRKAHRSVRALSHGSSRISGKSKKQDCGQAGAGELASRIRVSRIFHFGRRKFSRDEPSQVRPNARCGGQEEHCQDALPAAPPAAKDRA